MPDIARLQATLLSCAEMHLETLKLSWSGRRDSAQVAATLDRLCRAILALTDVMTPGNLREELLRLERNRASLLMNAADLNQLVSRVPSDVGSQKEQRRSRTMRTPLHKKSTMPTGGRRPVPDDNLYMRHYLNWKSNHADMSSAQYCEIHHLILEEFRRQAKMAHRYHL
jgi:hypothetical protein